MSLKSALIALAGNVGKCQENARSLKLELERGLMEVASDAPDIGGASEIVKLWKNTTPSSAFEASNIEIENADVYDGYVLVIMQESGNISAVDYIDASWINDDTAHYLNGTSVNLSAGNMKKEYRSLQLSKTEGSNKVKFAFGDGKSGTIATYGTAVSASTLNTILVPLYIIGIKF